MSSCVPPYSISEKMLSLVSEISEEIGKLSTGKGFESRPHLRRNNKIRSIHSSLKIEANSLSLSEVRDVINGHAVAGDAKEIQEVKNAYKAYQEIGKIDPASIADLKKLHGIMTYNTVKESGQFRKGGEGVFSGDKCIFIAPPAQMVPGLMSDLLNWLKKSKGSVHPLIQSAVFHYEFVFIHPFSDGNGRMARLWHTTILYNWNHVFEFIPLENQIEKCQSDYYDAIAECHTKGNSNAFIEFMLKMINQVLDDTLIQLKQSNDAASEYVKRLLAVMEYDVPCTSASIMEALGLKSKETLRKNYINPAISAGFIRMTLPDKPNSRNQRYVKL